MTVSTNLKEYGVRTPDSETTQVMGFKVNIECTGMACPTVTKEAPRVTGEVVRSALKKARRKTAASEVQAFGQEALKKFWPDDKSW